MPTPHPTTVDVRLTLTPATAVTAVGAILRHVGTEAAELTRGLRGYAHVEREHGAGRLAPGHPAGPLDRYPGGYLDPVDVARRAEDARTLLDTVARPLADAYGEPRDRHRVGLAADLDRILERAEAAIERRTLATTDLARQAAGA